MVYRICGGIAFLFLGLSSLGIAKLPEPVIGVFLLIAGIALLAGF
jgi:hypothetical protein